MVRLGAEEGFLRLFIRDGAVKARTRNEITRCLLPGGMPFPSLPKPVGEKLSCKARRRFNERPSTGGGANLQLYFQDLCMPLVPR